MMITMYEASVPTLRRYLGQLSKLVALAEAHVPSNEAAPDSLLQAALAPSMYPFASQVEITANFALRTSAPLAGLATPAYGAFDASFAGLQQRIAHALTFIDALTPAQFAGSAERTILDRAGDANIALPGRIYLLEYALPNFLFHLSTAYAILRHAGVTVGKGDFDGLHVYRRSV